MVSRRGAEGAGGFHRVFQLVRQDDRRILGSV